MNYERIFSYIGWGAIVLLLTGLSGWYFFIQRQTAAVESADAARGFSIGIPSFLGNRGSTAANSEVGSGGATPSNTGLSSGSGSRSVGSAFLQFLGIGEGERASTGGDFGVATGSEPGEIVEKKAPRLLRISAPPVAGAAFIGGTSTRLRYVERSTGYVIDVDPSSGESKRITNTLTPRVYEASLSSNNVVIQRVLEDGRATTLAAKVGTSTENGLAQLKSFNLGSNISELRLHPENGTIIMTTETEAGTSIVRSAWDGKNPTTLLTIPAGSFTLYTPSDSVIVVAEKAASGVPGNAYRVGTSLTPLLRNIPGLTVLPNTSGGLLYSSDTGNSVQLFVRTSSSTALELPLKTTTEKCVWAPSGGYRAYCAVPKTNPGPAFLDKWYRGALHTDDEWYEISAGGAEPRSFFTTDSMTAIDVEQPIVDSSDTYLAFINGRDKSLWLLRIKE